MEEMEIFGKFDSRRNNWKKLVDLARFGRIGNLELNW
jgi:hypothetical protein